VNSNKHLRYLFRAEPT